MMRCTCFTKLECSERMDAPPPPLLVWSSCAPPHFDFPQPQVLPHDPGHWLRNALVHGSGFNPNPPREHDVTRLEFKVMALLAAMRCIGERAEELRRWGLELFQKTELVWEWVHDARRRPRQADAPRRWG